MREIKEADWKVLRKLHAVASDRFCERVLADIERATSRSSRCSQSAHEQFSKVYALVQEHNRELGRCFDDLRRSHAFASVLALRSRALFSDEEFAMFSEEMRGAVDSVLEK